jgi:predicted SAM-dependent methyltransferase
MTNFGPPIDCDYLRANYADLAAFDDAALMCHYHAYGKHEGRIASPLCTRSGFLGAIPRTGRILEIGPFCNPVFQGPTVSYFDVLDSAGLIARAREHSLDPGKCPTRIDYVSPTGDLSIVREKFDTIFSSHCIEHQPDLIRHLNDAREVITPSGRYFLAIPDKRYCFDHFLEETTELDLIAAHLERRQVHTFRSVYNYIARTTHNNTAAHWAGNSTDPHGMTLAERGRVAEDVYKSLQGAYYDCHAWHFTPDSFATCMAALAEKRYIRFNVERIYATVRDSNEFFCILQPTP